MDLPNLGLASGLFKSLTTAVDAIQHCGSAVNFILPYSKLRAANVIGTKTLLKFAAT